MDLAMFDPAARLMATTTLEALETPCLVLDTGRMDRNITRLRNRLDGLGVSLRPHLKTAKSIDVARRVMIAPEGPATVSTLKEAEQFAADGLRDMIYAVGIAPAKLMRIVELRAKGVDLVVVLDTVEQARAVVEASRKTGTRIPAMIEIDCDGHRSGVVPANHAQLLEIGQALAADAELRGVLTHAGDSYKGGGPEAQQRYAEAERAAVVGAAQLLRGAGLPCPVVSVGSTPTAHHAKDLTGVTEVRAGVFVFFDLVMAGIGVCQVDDIALSVLATVIGHQREKGWIITDAGWMSLSRDRGTSKQAVDQGYGLVCDIHGETYGDIIVADANQEHGIIAVRPGSDARLPDLRVGDRVRILPNHACATAAQHEAYHVVQGPSHAVEARWPRFGGW
ncbi:DSD1 family PLP-dependent enzyme [Rhizobium etli]|uniref:D-serine deaminase-like pyridoxal phosphate-dependent protein n=1 Tax=Rhizobium etli TaxID=29449 RepID=A0A7W6YC13_RHIET|nr:DSD1 family PLP-dependent enzyme [Rhizobium etli]MBB4482813.1 D-serine deaminase-like pyridoxal phosphate-dependent protein [Rhizobium etli]MBB4538642.1 D-serine deaminase-like pyridoxal phosphate-dependent protein [Rhizobium etli]